MDAPTLRQRREQKARAEREYAAALVMMAAERAREFAMAEQLIDLDAPPPE